MLTFYNGSGSPYSWRVWLALEHKQIPYEIKMLSFSAGDLKTSEYLEINPRSRVPAIREGAFTLFESVAIVEYLDEAYRGGSPLFPGDAKRRALVRRLVQEADQYYAVAMERIVDQVLFTPQDRWDHAAIAAARSGLAEELRRWENYAGGAYLAGGEPTAADFTLYPLLALTRRMEKRKPDINLSGMTGPRVAAWIGRMESLPTVAKTWPPHWKTG